MTEFEMTEDDLSGLLDAIKPGPMIMLQCGTPASVQERANAAWAELGKRMGFDPMTVRPSRNGRPRFFYATALEQNKPETRISEQASEHVSLASPENVADLSKFLK